MTGYDGVLGYRTDIAYKTGKKLQDDQKNSWKIIRILTISRK